jgi:hypothetical protein
LGPARRKFLSQWSRYEPGRCGHGRAQPDRWVPKF